LEGRTSPNGPGKRVSATLARNVPSPHGRQDYIRVKLEDREGQWVAHPLLGKSGLISTMVKADGLVCIGLHEEGLLQGATVDVTLFD
jgi:molybdopterin molybdotransferase